MKTANDVLVIYVTDAAGKITNMGISMAQVAQAYKIGHLHSDIIVPYGEEMHRRLEKPGSGCTFTAKVLPIAGMGDCTTPSEFTRTYEPLHGEIPGVSNFLSEIHSILAELLMAYEGAS